MTAARPTGSAPRAGDAPSRTLPDGGPRPDETRFTGERPGWGEGFEYDYSRHLAAYLHALGFVTGRRVLDAGCGEGFGTRLLADEATEVVGVDHSDAAIAESRRLWGATPRLRFERVDLAAPAGFDERFDVVLSFQVFEHIRETRPFLEALRARLAPGGTLLLTTPNRLRSVSENPFHVREYSEDELRRELDAVFAAVEIRGMFGNDKVESFEQGREKAVRRILRLDPLGLRHLLPRAVVEFAFARLARLVRRQTRTETTIRPEDFFVADGPLDLALDLVAVCTARS